MPKNSTRRDEVILAAGGIVWRDGARGREIVLIHRPRHGDWTLPKGKLDPGESWQEAAVREVEEETGLSVTLGDFAGSCSYMTRTAPKVVLYWHMRLAGTGKFAPHDSDEVDALEWLPLASAFERLTHERERRLLAEASPSAASPPA
jgi:8-oxo-dGTP diphosphatase